jgi:hypothetical protein
MDIAGVVPTENSNSNVLVVYSAEDRQRNDLAKPLGFAMDWCVLAEGKMSSGPIVVRGIGRQNAAQVCLPEYDRVIETFPRIDPMTRSACPFCHDV